MREYRRLSEVLYAGAIASFCFSLVSGIMIIKHKIADKQKIKDTIVFKRYKQDNEISCFDDVLLPTESTSRQITIQSKLSEVCKYSISFTNHKKVVKEDQYFIISVRNEKETLCDNKSLKEIFDTNFSIQNLMIDSYGSDTIYFDFSVKAELTKSVDFTFDILVKSQGKWSY